MRTPPRPRDGDNFGSDRGKTIDAIDARVLENGALEHDGVGKSRRVMRWHAPGALLRGDVLAGLMFVAVGALGLFLSRHYPVGTALRMGTGYMPRLLCWILLVLGLLVAAQALVFSRAPPLALQWSGWRPLLFVTLAVLVFGFTIERLGVVAATAFLVLVGAFARRGLRPLEIVATAFLLVVFTVGIFVWGLGLTLDVWPEW